MNPIRSLLLFFPLVVLLPGALAQFPTGVFKASQCATVVAEAQKAGKPIAVYLTKFDSNDKGLNAANAVTVPQLKRDYFVMAVTPKQGDSAFIPAAVMRAVESPALGSDLPNLVIFTPDLKREIASAGSAQLRNVTSPCFPALTAQVKMFLQDNPIKPTNPTPGLVPLPQGVASESKAPDKSQPITWILADGSTVTGSFVSVFGGSLKVRLKDGSIKDIVMLKLSSLSQAKARQMAEQK